MRRVRFYYGEYLFKLKTEEAYFEKCKADRFKLSIDEVMNNICTNDENIINTLYDLNLKLLDKEDGRFSALDSKGSNILGMAGVALALIFSLGGLLIEKIGNRPLFFTDRPAVILSILYMITVSLMLVSVIFAFLAVRARTDIKTVKDEDIFTKEITSNDENYYKRYLIAHYWLISQNNFLVNEIKGRWLKCSHWFFAASMVFLLMISTIIGLYSLNKANYPQAQITSKENIKMSDGKKSENAPPPKPTPKPSSGINKTADVVKVEPTAKPSGGKVTTYQEK